MSKASEKNQAKVIILGLSQSGKTSIRQVIFEGFAPEATTKNPATVRINRKLFNLAGGGINLYDIGGQSNYLNEVFQQYKERTFSEVRAAIFVVDVSDAANIMRSKYYFDLTMENLTQQSKKAKAYVFAHKMDIVPLNKRKPVIQSIADIFEIEKYPMAEITGTSIFDDSVWDAMQKVLSYVYPRDDAKTSELKSIVGHNNLEFLALSTSQGLVLYSEPEVTSGVNYGRLKLELSNTYFPGMILDQAMFTYGNHSVMMKEIEDDLILTIVYPTRNNITEISSSFGVLSEQIGTLFKPAELLGQAKEKMKQTLITHLKGKGIKNVENIERRLDAKISVKCDACGKQLQKSILQVALENPENLDKGINVKAGMGVTTVEVYPVHECIEGIREVPVILDGNLEYRRYDKSRPI